MTGSILLSIVLLALCLQTKAFRMMKHSRDRRTHGAATVWTKALRMSGEMADKYCEDVTRAIRRPTW